jgi:hypothetical protein
LTVTHNVVADAGDVAPLRPLHIWSVEIVCERPISARVDHRRRPPEAHFVSTIMAIFSGKRSLNQYSDPSRADTYQRL